MRNLLPALLFLCLTSAAFGQRATVRGVVRTEGGEPVQNAAVVLISTADSSRIGDRADASGRFMIANVPYGTYTLRASYVGYQEYRRVITVNDTLIRTGVIQLKPSGVEVKVEKELTPTIQKGDTTEVNAGAFKVNPDATTEDLVQKMPGVTLEGGKVKAQGEEVKKVLVDGKPFFGDDPNAAMKNLPADAVDKVQIYDEQSEQARFSGVSDGNTTKTINIVTKPGMRNGIFGRVTAAGGADLQKDGIGDNARYLTSGSLNIFQGQRRITILAQSNNVNQQNFSGEDLAGLNTGGGGFGGFGGMGGMGRWGGGGAMGNFLVGGQNGINTTHAFGLNYTDQWSKKVSVSGSYFFNMTDQNARQELVRRYVLPQQAGQVYRQTSLTTGQNMNNRLNFRLDYTIDTMRSIVFRPRVSFQTNNSQSLLDANTKLTSEASASDGLLNQTINSNNTSLTAYNVSNELIYKHRFAKFGRGFTVSLNGTISANTGDRFLKAENSFFSNGSKETDLLNQKTILDNTNQSITAEFDYNEPIGKHGLAGISYEGNFRRNNSDRKTFNSPPAEENYSSLDTFLSNVFLSDYNSNEAGLSYRYAKGKLQWTTKLEYQYAFLANERTFPTPDHVNRGFSSVLPSANMRYEVKKGTNLRVFYRTSTNAPSVTQLQNVIDNTNPLQLIAGNPNLQQEYRHNLFGHYSTANTRKGTNFFGMVHGSYTANYIGNSTIISGQDSVLSGGKVLPQGAQLIVPVNLDGNYSVRTFMTFGFPDSILKSKLNFNFSANYNRTPGLINGRLNYSNNQTYSLGATIASNISPELDFNLSSWTSYNIVINSLQKQSNANYFSENVRLRFNWIFYKGFLVQTDVTTQIYSGLSGGFNKPYTMWNAALGKKFLKNNAGEIRLTVYDILNQNNNIQRTVTDAYIEDAQSNVLQRYFLVSFTYNLRRMGGKSADAPAPPMNMPGHGPGHFRH